MKTSVVMCTYNGEKYVTEQMESLRLQTLLADEVLIFDDCSIDGTVGLIQDYIEKYSLAGWKLVVNDANKGYRMNFLDGIRQASGDIIYFCDQDDIWDIEKIQRMNDAFGNPNVSVLECMETRFDDDGQDNYRLANSVYGENTGKLKKCDFIKKMKIPNGSGHTLAFRKEFADIVVPVILEHNLNFDITFADVGSIYGQYYILEVPLVRHRVHSAAGGNATSPQYSLRSRVRDLDRQIISRNFKLNRVKLYRSIFADDFSDKDRKTIDDFIEFLERRVRYMEEQKLFRCFFQTFRYNRMNDFNFCLIDVLAIFYNRRSRRS